MKTFFSSTVVLLASFSPALAFDDCLTGTWSADQAAFQAQMTANPNMGDVQVSGNILMTLGAAGGQFTLNDLSVTVQNPGVPLVVVTLTGTGNFATSADAGSFQFTMGDFNYFAQAQVDMGGSMMNMDIPFSDEMSPMGSGANGTYTCNATRLTFNANTESQLVNLWHRQ